MASRRRSVMTADKMRRVALEVFKARSIGDEKAVPKPEGLGNRLPLKHFFEFGLYRIDVALSRLERGADVITLPPKAFDVLLLLARNHHRVMSKPELMETLWPDTFVEEANLTQHVYTLRKALGEQPGGAPYIETVPRRGYRLSAPVREVRDEGAGPTSGAFPAEAQAAPGAAPAVLEGERKQATVLRCGVVNAAALAERLGPSGLVETMDRLAELAGEEVARFEGVLQQRREDELVALFGASVVHEDDAWRAVLASLAIQRRLPELAPAGSPDDERLAVRIGLHTGPVIVSRRRDHGAGGYSAVGETMRIADLLQQLAEPGTILISDTTRRAAEGYFQVEPAAIDTRATGLAAFRVVGLVSQAAVRAPRPKRALTPFVGRRHELALLADLAEVALGGKGQVTSVVGEPGMGKSRLVHELAQAVAADGAAAVLEGRCVSYGSLVPYLPLLDLVRAHCGIEDADTPEDVRHAVARAVRESDLSPDAEAWLLRLIGALETAGAPETLSPEAVKARTFDVLRGLLLKATLRRPVVIVVEDLQWVDRTSEEFLATLVERLGPARMMLVATYRPGYHAPWMDRSYVTQVTLTPLTTADSAALVDSLAREQPLPEGVSAAILARAEGNPFFLEELARTVVDHRPEGQGIPDTVQGVIMARLDHLPEPAKRLLQTASVLGREVPRKLLARVCGGATDLSAELADLCRLEFLYERPAGGETVFVFKHALTQDVAYDSLLARRRAELHLAAALGLQELYADRLDEITATLAYHYARTDLVGEAVTWLMRAADRAARVYANSEAILHLDLARRRLERLAEGPDRDRRMVEVALRHAHSLYFLGRFRESVEALLPHEARLSRLSDPGLTAAASFWLAHMYSRLGDQGRAADSAHRAIAAATRAGDEATLGKAHGLLALEAHWSGKAEEGITHGREAVRLLGPRPDQRWWLAMAHFYIAINHLLTGAFDAALAEAAKADAVGKEIGDPRLQSYAGFAAGWVEASRGNHEAAVAVCRRSRAQAPDRVSRAYASMFLGYALLEQGDHRAARALLEPAVVELESFGLPQWHAWSSVLSAEAYRLDGALDVAAGFVKRGLEVATRAQYWYAVGFAERVRARIARDRGHLPEGFCDLERAVQTFDRIGATFEAARSRLDVAAACAGDRERAAREIAAARTAFESLGVTAYRARAAALAQRLEMR